MRSAFDRLASGIDTLTDQLSGSLPGGPDPWAARNAYVDVVVGAEEATAFAARWLGVGATPDERDMFLALMAIQRWRLAMFASDAWFWEEPVRVETLAALRAAAWAARRMDTLAGSNLERRLLADLATFTSPKHGIDGAEIYRMRPGRGRPGLTGFPSLPASQVDTWNPPGGGRCRRRRSRSEGASALQCA